MAYFGEVCMFSVHIGVYFVNSIYTIMPQVFMYTRMLYFPIFCKTLIVSPRKKIYDSINEP